MSIATRVSRARISPRTSGRPPGPAAPDAPARAALDAFGVGRIGRHATVRIVAVASWLTLTVLSVLALPSDAAGRAGGIALLVVFTGAWLWTQTLRREVTPVVGSFRLLLLAASGGALSAVAPAGQVYAIVFAICAIAPVTLPVRWARAVAAATVVIEFPVLVASGDNGVIGSLLIVSGAGFFFLVSAGSVASREALQQVEQAREAQARAAVLDERGRIARELHDILAHTLSGLAVQIEGARLLAERRGADPEIERRLAGAHTLAVTGLDEARRAVGALRDGAVPGPGELPAVVAEYGPRASYEVSGLPRPVPAPVGVALYRTAQEALTNARRHAGGPEVTVRLAWLPAAVRLEIEDCGGGCEPAAGTGGGHGLIGMRERAELAGGRLEAGPSPRGWSVRLELPA